MSEGEGRRFHGKYRATVVSNVDPNQRGRLLVQAVDVDGLFPTTWAMPCVPFSGRQMGWWAIPQIGAGVWVEFEDGDANHPIWVGTWFRNAAEVPALALTAPPLLPNLVVQTQGQTTFMLSDVPGPTGGILLKTKSGAFISITDAGITISNGQGATISMIGPAVAVNRDGLVVN